MVRDTGQNDSTTGKHSGTYGNTVLGRFSELAGIIRLVQTINNCHAMKKVFLFIVCVVVFMSCSKTDINEPFSGTDLKAGAASPAVFIVEPNGSDDTPALVQAFEDAKAAGTGSIVILVEGEYKVGYMEIYDFYGSLQGAGKGQTVITVLPGIDLNELFARHQLHCMIKFIGGDVCLSNFTIRTPPGRLSTGGPGWGHIYSLMSFSSFNPLYEPGNESRTINVTIDNVSFKGQRMEEGGYPGYTGYSYNCVMGVRAGFDYYPIYSVPENLLPREKIDFKIINSDFETFCYGIAIEGTMNSRLIIGEKNNGNVFSNTDQDGGIWENRNAEVSIEGNTFNITEFGYGIDLDDYPWYKIFRSEPSEKPTIFNVQNNAFKMTHSEYALFLRNTRARSFPEEPPVIYNIKNNVFSMADGYEWGIISYFTKGIVIRNNKLTGYGDLALYLVNWSQGGLVMGNNFSTAVLGTGVAYLTASTKDWTFIGGNADGLVINYGTNNLFAGFSVSKSDVPFGQTIVDNLQATKDALKELKNH